MNAPTECPTCGVDITVMDAVAFRDHTKAEHPELYDLISSAFRRLGGVPATKEEQT